MTGPDRLHSPTVWPVTAETVYLLGSEASVYGQVASDEVGRAGVAISRGRFPKSVAWVDPNEDAVLAARAGDRWLLVAADGHFGFTAALAAVNALRSAAPQLLSDDGDGRTVVRSAVERARAEVAESLSTVDETRTSSRTALSVVLIRGRAAFAATCGDTSVFLVRSRRTRSITSTSRFLGPRTPPPAVVRLRLRPGDALALVTDGVTDFLGAGLGETLYAELSGPDPARAAEGLVRAAFAGGAGDNVGVTVLLPQSTGRGRHR